MSGATKIRSSCNAERPTATGPGSQLSRLNTLVADAVNVLQDGLHDEDIKVRIVAAVHILKATGVYGAPTPGAEETDPAESQPTMR